jgi:hypothetical protein
MTADTTTAEPRVSDNEFTQSESHSCQDQHVSQADGTLSTRRSRRNENVRQEPKAGVVSFQKDALGGRQGIPWREILGRRFSCDFLDRGWLYRHQAAVDDHCRKIEDDSYRQYPDTPPVPVTKNK